MQNGSQNNGGCTTVYNGLSDAASQKGSESAPKISCFCLMRKRSRRSSSLEDVESIISFLKISCREFIIEQDLQLIQICLVPSMNEYEIFPDNSIKTVYVL